MTVQFPWSLGCYEKGMSSSYFCWWYPMHNQQIPTALRWIPYGHQMYARGSYCMLERVPQLLSQISRQSPNRKPARESNSHRVPYCTLDCEVELAGSLKERAQILLVRFWGSFAQWEGRWKQCTHRNQMLLTFSCWNGRRLGSDVCMHRSRSCNLLAALSQLCPGCISIFLRASSRGIWSCSKLNITQCNLLKW